MEHGELMKKLRTERHITQAQLAGEKSGRSTISTFEHQESKLFFDKAVEYLGRMNISLEEYEYLYYSSHISAKRESVATVSKCFKQPFDPSLLLRIYKQYEDTGDFFYYSLFAQYLLIHKFINHDPKTNSLKYDKMIPGITKKVSEYLDSIYIWGRFELVLFSNCLFLFSNEYIRFCYTDLIRRMRIMSDSSNYSRDIFKFLVNGTQLAYERNYAPNYVLFSNELKRVAQIYGDTEARLVYKIFSVLLRRKNGLDVTEKFGRLRDTLDFLNESYWLDYITECKYMDVLDGSEIVGVCMEPQRGRESGLFGSASTGVEE